MTYQVEIEEEQRQMVLLALAELALSRPGWDWTLKAIAISFRGGILFEDFKIANADRVKAERGPLCGQPYLYGEERDGEGGGGGS